MARKKINTLFDYYILPSNLDEIRTFIEKYKSDMMGQIVSSIDFALKHKLPFVEVFHFKNSNFVITIAKDHFKENLDNVYKFSVDSEDYELCLRASKLRDHLTKISQNEKKKNDGSNGVGN